MIRLSKVTVAKYSWLYPLVIFLLALLVLGVVLAFSVVTVREILQQTRGVTYGRPDDPTQAFQTRVGVNAALEQYSGPDLARAFEWMQANHMSLVRQHFYWNAIEPRQGQFDWSTWDQIVDRSVESRVDEFGEGQRVYGPSPGATAPARGLVDGQTLILTGGPKTGLRYLDIHSGKVLKQFPIEGYQCTWSRDGKRIAFIRQAARGNQPRATLQEQPDPWTIWEADAATGKIRAIIDEQPDDYVEASKFQTRFVNNETAAVASPVAKGADTDREPPDRVAPGDSGSGGLGLGDWLNAELPSIPTLLRTRPRRKPAIRRELIVYGSVAIGAAFLVPE